MTISNGPETAGQKMSGNGVPLDNHDAKQFELEFKAICAEVLKLEVDELDDSCSFVLQGGDSISAISLIARCEERGIELKTADVIKAQSISELFLTTRRRLPWAQKSEGARILNGSGQENIDPMPFALWSSHHKETPMGQQQLLEEVASLCDLEVEDIEDVYPCTPLQEGLMAITTRQPAAYVDRRAFSLAESIDLDRFQAAWETLATRTPILRTRIIMDNGGRSLQVVARDCISWRQGSSLKDYLSQDREEGMTLGQPLARFGLVQGVVGERIFVWTAHHSIYDGWSALLLYRQLAAIYFHDELPRSIPYARFIHYLDGKDPTTATSYWRDQLQGNVMADWPPLPRVNYQPSPRCQFKSHINIPQGSDQGLIMMSNVLRAAWALVMAQYTGHDDIAFAVTLSGRNAPVSQVADIVAPLITTVPLRVRTDRTQTVADFLQDIQYQAIEMIDHEHTGLQKIKTLLPELSAVLELRNLLIIQPASERDIYQEFSGLCPVPVVMEDFDSYALNVECTLGRLVIDVDVNYDEDVIATPYLESVMEQFSLLVQQLCSSLAEGGKTLLHEVTIIRAQDKQQFLTWNEKIPSSVDRCIQQLVQDQVMIRSTASAIDAWDGKLTYAELASQSIRMAHYLVSLGVGPERTVGLCMEKSKWAIVAMLATLYAGGAVLPVSVSHPLPRIHGIIQEARANVTLVDEKQQVRLASLDTNLIVVDSRLLENLPLATDPPQTGATPDNAAWVNYTSGSTGNPKGVILEHRSLCTSLTAHAEAVGIHSYTRTLQFAAFTFDVSLCDIFSTLQAGGCVCVPSEEERMNSLAEFACRMDVNYAELTSTVTETMSPSQVPSLSTLVLSGEPLKPTVLSTWGRHSSVFNSYGPTECSIVSSNSKRLLHIDDAQNIGKPMKSVFWVVQATDYHQLCPIGAPGELLIEGPLLARGYLNDEEKTKAAFITEPAFLKQLGLAPGRRMYRTGDLVRQNQDGAFTYLGRCDSKQVKIRGQRVEISEIECHIVQQLPSVRTVAVELVEQGAQMSLVAVMDFVMDSEYAQMTVSDITTTTPMTASGTLVPIETLRPVLEDLRRALLQLLPTYMVPTLYVPMATMPTNASGKLDRRAVRTQLNALSITDLQRYMSSGGPKAKPSTEMEQQVQALWAEALAIDPGDIGIHDNFFQIGGDSVAAMRLVALKSSRQLQLKVVDIFQHAQLSALAHILEGRTIEDKIEEDDPAPFDLWEDSNSRDSEARAQQIARMAEQCGVPMENIEDIYPCTPLQEGLIAITARQPTAYVSRQVYKLADSIDWDHFQAAWQTLAEVTPILRTRILVEQDNSGGRSLQIVVRDSLVWQYSTNLDEYMTRGQEEGVTLGQPLVRFGLVQQSNERFFVWTAHHSVYDGWSTSLMYQHLTDIYLKRRVPSTIPYSRFIRYLRRRDKATSTRYWSDQLQGDVVVNWPPLPRADYQPQPMQRYVYDISLPKSKAYSRAGSMLPNILRAAWALIMAKHAGQGDNVVFGVTISGRNAPVWQIGEMAAPTITTVPVRIGINRQQTVDEFLAAIQQQAADMIEYEHTGLQVIKKLIPELSSSLDLRNLLVIQPAAQKDSTDFPGLEPLPVNLKGFDSYGLTIQCTLGSEVVTVETRYDENVIDTPQLERVVKSFAHVVKQLYSTRTDTYRLGDISLVSADDEEAILRWNRTAPPRVERCIHELVQEQIKRRPDATAICAWDGELTYGEMASQATRLSQYLRGLGVCPERMVGLCMDKSKWAGVSMLAILQAGGVVVPLGVAHPQTRIEGIVADTKANIILVDATQQERLSTLENVRLVTVNADLMEALPASTREEGLQSNPAPDNAAWVIYTSGSTGKPKGVVLQHVALCSSFMAHGARFKMGFHTRMLQFAAHTFDACIQDYFTTLSWGGVVCVPSEDDRMSDLTTVIRTMEVNFATLTSTVARLIQPSEVPSMQKLALVGEPVKADVVKQWLGHAIVLNAYGPSECSIHSTCGEPLVDATKSAVIGTGMGTRLWVADVADYNQLCPVGAPGELLIEGPLLAREYLNDAQKTRAAFIINPDFIHQLGLQPDQTERRMYRTGDLVRQNEDGSITHLGRRDTQIKIRGQRVEVGEIEYQIAQQLPGARSVAVELLEQDGQQVSLTAVVDFVEDSEHRDGLVTELGTLIPTTALYTAFEKLRGSLFQVLPTYMVPAVFVPIVDMPLNASSKLDRREIRALLQRIKSEDRQQYSSVDGPKVTPSTPMERQLQVLWADALSTPLRQVGVYDNFFQIGGDSVVAMRLVATAPSRELQLTVADIFQYPRLADLADLLAKRLIYLEVEEDPMPFALWLDASSDSHQQQQQLQEAAKQCGIAVEQIQDVYPCTPLQEGLMAITARQSSAYINRQVFKLAKSIDLDRFQAAWQALSAVTPILRTRILMSQGVSSSLQLVVNEDISWRRSGSLKDYINLDQEEGMALGKPLVRYGLVQEEASGERFFVWTAHHSLYDGWSTLLIYRQLTDIYLSGSVPSTVPFSRFIRYLAHRENTEVDTATYWSNQLQGDVMANWPPLPHVDYQPRPRHEITRVVQLPKRGSGDVVTTSNLLRAAWALVMAQYAGHDDVVFAVTVSGRNAPVPQVDSIVAPTITTVPVRVRVDWTQNTTSFLRSLQQQAAEMIDHEHTGLRAIKALVPHLGPALELRNVLVVQAAEERNAANQFPGIEPLSSGAEDFDSHGLTVDCTLSEDELRVDFRYDHNVVATSQAKRIIAYFTHLVQQLYDPITNRARQLGDLVLVSPEDQRQISEWNATIEVSRLDQCIHELFYEQAAARPQAPAVCAWDGNITYGDLASQSLRLAHHLSSLGVGPEKKVGLCMDKSKWAIVAMLATLQAGGVIVPLGVTHPLPRLEIIIQDTAADLILVDAQQQERLAGLNLDVRLVTVNNRLLEGLPLGTLSTGVTPDNAAWVIYTSGSTGTPKGVVLEHGGLCTSMRTQGTKMHLSTETRALNFSPFTFDVSISDISATLMYGGCICLLSESDRTNNLAGSIRAMDVNFASLTPTVARMLSPTEVPSLRTLALTGEALKPDVVSIWNHPEVAIYDTYGPSEGSVCTCHGPVSNPDEADNIGFPMSTRHWVTQPHNYHQLCPLGAPGELLIEGPLLARGYLNNLEKTKASFVIDPDFTKQQSHVVSGRRMYRTGDLVRQSEDGSFIFLGRRDTQVKIRGQRVEVGEIEHQIVQQLPGAQTAVVHLLEHDTQMSLVAVMDFKSDSNHGQGEVETFGTLAPTSTLRSAFNELRQSLLQVLPAYMVPAIYVPVAHMPMNISGKLDRRAVHTLLTTVPAGSLGRYMVEEGVSKIAPSTEMEKVLQELWARMLGIAIHEVGADDNFFQVGGDSVTAMRIVAATTQTSELQLTVSDIFQNPRLSDLARVLDERMNENEDHEMMEDQDPEAFALWGDAASVNAEEQQQSLATIAEQCGVDVEQIEDIYPCTPLQEGLLAITARQPSAYVSRQVYALSEQVNIDRFQAAWQTLAATTPILRTRALMGRGASWQVVVRDDITWRYHSSLEEYIKLDQEEGISLGQPLARYGLIQQPSGEQLFVWTAHHSIYDGWTIRLLCRELINIYRRDDHVPRTIPYSRFIHYLTRTNWADSVNYWRRQLEGDVVADWPSLPRADYEPRARHSLRKCIPLSQDQGRGIAMANILRGAWGLVMAQFSGQNDVVFAANVSGRNAPVREVTEIIGPTITTVPVRVRFNRDSTQTVEDFLQRVQRQAIEMIDHEHTGLQVIQSLAPELKNSVLQLRNLLVIQPAAESDTHLDFPGIEPIPLPVEDFDSYGLNVECTLGQEITVEARFDENIVATPYMNRVLNQFTHIVEQLCDPSIRPHQLKEVSLLSPQDERQISTWNAILPVRIEKCVHDLVEEQAQARPTAPAVWAWDGELTYSELTRLAQHLAHRIVALGIRPEQMAGGVVVPLGVSHPVTRIETILQDTGASLVLVNAEQHERLAGLRSRLLVVDADLWEGLPTQTKPPQTSVTPGNAAWVIYTSGTTGTPKGAVLEHGTLCTSIRAHGTRYGFGPHTRKIQYAAHTFDGTIEDYFTTLSWGGVCCVPSEEDRLNMRKLTAFMRLTEVNSAATTYTVARLFSPDEVPTLHTLVLGGEPATVDVTNLWRTKVNLFNCYGPSECSIFSTAAGPIQNVDEIHNIGFPIGTRLWIVNAEDYNQLCPIGAPGELLIEGPQLARGYLNDEKKTNAAFISDPDFMKRLGLPAGRRMYRSGDIVRQKDDGSLVYVTRRDTQVKIRGQRVEIGEIEHQITQGLADTRTVAVELLKLGTHGQPVLVATIDFTDESKYRIGDGEVTISGLLAPTAALREAFEKLYSALFQVLPGYMVPTAYVPVTQMPRNLSGKLDRRALRELLEALSSNDMQQYLAGEAKVPPSTDMEHKLQALWAEALGIDHIDRVGAHDNFFQIGGDSVAAMRLVTITKQRELKLSVADIFSHPRLSELGRVLTERILESEEVEEDPEPFALWSRTSTEELEDVAARCNVAVDAVEDIYPCTPLQEGMMAITARQSAAYISRQVYALATTQINLDWFQAAWQTLALATPILRTRLLIGQDSRAMQVVVRDTISWRYGTDLDAYISHDREEGMNLGQPLVRYSLIQQQSTGDCYFIWTAHHSIYDGWTMRAICKRLVNIYNSGDTSYIPPTIPYSRFIRHLTRTDPLATADYWRNQLEGDAMADWPPLPRIDYQPTPRHRLTQSIVVPKGVHGGRLASNILRAAWALVMAQYTGHPDVVFAATVSGRNAPVWQIGEIAAPTLTTVPVRIAVDGNMTVGQFLQAVQDQAIQMIPYEHTGLQRIKTLVPEVTAALELRNVLVIQLAEERENRIEFPGLDALPVPFEDFDSFGIHLECTLGSDRIEVEIRYDENVVATPYLQRVVDHFASVVQQFHDSASSEQPLRTLPLHAQEEHQIVAWNTKVPSRLERCIHELVHDHVVSQPTALAICGWDGDLTYAELSSHAARLAGHLVRQLGVGPERMVGLCMDKSQWAVVAMLAVLYAGGVVVPLGVAHPVPRINGILQDAASEVVLVDTQQQERLSGLGTQLITIDATLLDELPSLNEGQQPALLQTGVTPNHLAWVVYTSGSTGTPKGVMLEHGALSTSIEAHGSAFGMDKDTRTLQLAAHTFDAAIQDIFTTLCKGGCVCIPSEHDRLNHLTQSMVSMDVNFVNLTSTVASMLVPDDLPSLRTMILAGEAVTPTAVGLWSQHVTIFNSYGPSECSINSSCSKPVKDAARASNVGLPLSCCFWVVDPQDYNYLSPIGAPGELLIEGPIQARGYLNDEEKTNASFVVDPDFTKRLGLSGRRMYRTGDLVRQNTDGSLDYLGRRDLQVKIRGQRVEVGEIEYQIKQQLAGARTVAVERLQKGAQGEQIHLIAVMDFADTSEHHPSGPTRAGSAALAPTLALRTTFEQLRQSLLRVLPSYMVPAAYLPVAQMPLNASNKLDRRAIRALLAHHTHEDLQQYIGSGDRGSKAGPRTEMERQLQTLWAEALGVPVDAVGMNDHFFQLGGDSVTAMRIVAATASRELQLTVGDLFQYPRLADLAQNLSERPGADGLADEEEDPAPFELWEDLAESEIDEEQRQLADVAARCGVHVDQIEDVYPCTPLQEGLMAITGRQPAAYVSRQVYALDCSVDRVQFQAAWQTLAATAHILRTRILMGSHALQVVVSEQIVWRYGTNLDEYLLSDRKEGMALGQPLVRYGWVEDPSGQCYFIWTAHHALYDGWTLRTLGKRLIDIYRHDRSQPSIPYTRFVRYLQHGRPEAAASTDYWRAQLQGEVMSNWPPLPRADYQPLPKDHLRQLIPLPPGHDQGTVVISNVLRAAWALVMAQYAGHSDVAFAATVSGRNAPVWEIADIPAPTITTVPLCIRVDQAQNVAQFLQTVQQQAVEMIDYEHTGLQGIKTLVPDLGPALDLRNLLVVQPADESDSEARLDFPGLEAIPMPIEPFNSYGVTLECKLGAQEILVDVHYDTEIISQAQLGRVVDHFSCVVQRLCNPAAGSSPVAEIAVISEQDRQQVLAWNATVPPRVEKCIHEMVQERVEQSPRAVAVHAWDGDLTYRECHDLAARLAHHLVSLGIGPESLVGLCMDKSKWGPVAMLAILQAGGAIMPLGVSHPLARIDSILENSHATVILVDAEQHERLSQLTTRADLRLITIDTELLEKLPAHIKLPETGVKPDNASWAIFTSGSTGVPKGVIIEHVTMSTSLHEQGCWLGLSPETRFLQFSSYTFDNCITDTFATMIFGGCVCVPAEEARMNQLPEVMRDMGVNIAMLTSTVACQISPTQVPSLRKLILTGEPVRADVVSTWLGSASIYNAYGPTEGSMSTCTRPYTTPSQVTNIGCGLATRLWVTQPTNHHQLCPIGAPGELLIEGPLLARGYLNDPEKTDAAFIMDPEFTKRLGLRGRRMYRTGDLVRQNEDGSLIHLGRRDTQIKIRGQRVEIGEIEYQITQHLPEASTVAVELLKQGAQGQQVSLVAAIEFIEESEHRRGHISALGTLAPSEALRNAFAKLRGSLFQVLPSYMVPAAFVPVAQMSRNLSGKLDRIALRTLLGTLEIDDLRHYLAGEGPKVAPSTEMERQLQALWAEALDISVDQVGVHDNFFQIGGDSVVAMRIVAASHSSDLTLTVADLFQHPCVSELAQIVGDRSIGEIQTPEEEVTPFSLTGATDIDAFIQQVVSPTSGCNAQDIVDVLPTTDFQSLTIAGALTTPRANLAHFLLDGNGPCDIQALKKSCLNLIQATEALRTAYVFHQGRLLQVIRDSYEPEIHIFQTDNSVEVMTTEIINKQMSQPPGLGQPFTQIAIIQESKSPRHRVILRLTHAEYDAVSMDAIWQTLRSLYEGTPIQPHPQFSSFLYNQRQRITPDTYTYWQDLLKSSAMTALSVSTQTIGHYPSKVAQTAPRTIQMTKLPVDGVTSAMVVKAAWAVVLSRISDSRDVIFADTVSSRGTVDPSLMTALGCCVNLLPVRVQLPHGGTVEELLLQVRNQQVQSMQNAQLGFREILHECTDWPTSTRFTSALNHIVEQASRFTMRDIDYSISAFEAKEATWTVDVGVTTVQRGSDLDIRLSFLPENVSEAMAYKYLNALGDTLEHFLDNPFQLVEKVLSLCSATRVYDRSVTNKKPYQSSLEISEQDSGKAKMLYSHLKKTPQWESVLQSRRGADGRDKSGSFSQRGGDLLDALYLSSLLAGDDHCISVESILAGSRREETDSQGLRQRRRSSQVLGWTMIRKRFIKMLYFGSRKRVKHDTYHVPHHA
uniref:NRPS n=1 Tax=Phialomyces arenicola TaxID=168477 RepID=A0A6H0XBH8_9EURO|nr:NRPS [Phialomyces arenicola]